MAPFDKWDCTKCNEIMKISRGCEEPVSPARYRLAGEPLFRCPRRPILEDPEFIGELLFLYGAYTKGFLPEGGGLYSQPNAFVEYMKVIDSTLAECNAWERAKT